MRNFNSRLDDKGFTLVELIVTLAIAAIVMTVAGNYLFFGNRMFAENEIKNTDKYIGDTIYDFIKERLTYAGKIEVLEREKVLSGDASPAYSHVFALSGNSMENTDGYLYFTNDKTKLSWNNENADIYGTGFYRNNKITYTFQIDKKDASNRSFILTVYVYNKDGEEVYKTGASIKNLNIELENKTGQIETQYTGEDIYQVFKNPVVSYEEKNNKIIDPLEIAAKKIRDEYVGTYEMLWDTKPNGIGNVNISQVPDWATYSNSARYDNDAIRNYVCGKYYADSWQYFEGFKSEMLENLEPAVKKRIEDYLEVNTLYYQPMIGLPGSSSFSVNGNNEREFAEERCFIYLGANSKAHGSFGQWKAYFVYDHEKNIWYASMRTDWSKKKMDGQGIASSNWLTLKTDLEDKTKWIPLNKYE